MSVARQIGNQPGNDMTYRQWLIGQALAGIVATGYANQQAHPTAASVAVGLADAVLARLADEVDLIEDEARKRGVELPRGNK